MYDYIIIGGGAAGSVLANRLSAKSTNNVLLVESGMDTPPGNEPSELLDVYAGKLFFNPRFDWPDLKVTTQVVSHNNPNADRPPLRKYTQARVLGGGTSINGQLCNRGAPSDYDEWETRGAAGWGWKDVLPYFKKIESDRDFDGPLHGKTGPMPVNRIPKEHWTGLTKAFARACELEGFRYLPDQNGEFTDGYFPTTFNNESEKRVSAATAYLGRDVRQRPNLKIMTETHVTQLLFKDKRSIGIKAIIGGVESEILGGEIILSCGAIHSPAHLLRAGIGPVGDLRDMEIPIVMGLEGVGKGLMDHPSIGLSSYSRPTARMNDYTRRHFQMALRYSSGLPGVPQGDMFCAALSKSAWHAVGARLASMLTFVNKTYSETGNVKLSSRDPMAEPTVEFNLLSDRRDLERLKSGFRKMAALQMTAPFMAVTDRPFPSALSERVRNLSQINLKNKVLTSIAATLLDGPQALRHYLIDNFIVEGFSFEQLMSDDEALEAFVIKQAIGVWHASCSCRMGKADDPMSVVDKEGRVKGLQKLRVVDASIFPVVPCANTTFPTLMLAEKIADVMLNSRAA